MDGVKTFRLAEVLAADARDKHGLRFVQSAQFVDMAIDVMGQKRQGVLVVARGAERTARIHADEEGGLGLARFNRLSRAAHERSQKEGAGNCEGRSALHDATFFGSHRTVGSNSPASTMSFKLLNGMPKTGFPVLRIIAKLSWAAARCNTGNMRNSMSSWALPCSQ